MTRLNVILGLVVLGLLFAHIAIGGTVPIAIRGIVAEILAGDQGGDDPQNSIIWRLRLPRAIGCMFAGSILAAVGAAFQSLFRNPLAEPYVIGVSSGAAVGGTIAIVLGLGGAFGGLGVVGLAFVGGSLSLLLVLGLSRLQGAIDVVRLLLAGVVIGSMMSAVMTLVMLLSGHDTNQIMRWLLGSTTPMFWPRVALLGGASLLGTLCLLPYSRQLNAFAMDEFAAERLGVQKGRLVAGVLGIGTAMTAVCVGSVGIIGFLGLVAPHIARSLVGPDLRRSLPASALIGSALLLAADILAQRVLPGTELPIGAVTAIIGAPVLLIMLKERSQGFR